MPQEGALGAQPAPARPVPQGRRPGLHLGSEAVLAPTLEAEAFAPTFARWPCDVRALRSLLGDLALAPTASCPFSDVALSPRTVPEKPCQHRPRHKEEAEQRWPRAPTRSRAQEPARCLSCHPLHPADRPSQPGAFSEPHSETGLSTSRPGAGLSCLSFLDPLATEITGGVPQPGQAPGELALVWRKRTSLEPGHRQAGAEPRLPGLRDCGVGRKGGPGEIQPGQAPAGPLLTHPRRGPVSCLC